MHQNQHVKSDALSITCQADNFPTFHYPNVNSFIELTYCPCKNHCNCYQYYYAYCNLFSHSIPLHFYVDPIVSKETPKNINTMDNNFIGNVLLVNGSSNKLK